MMKKIMFYVAWLLSTFGAIFLAPRPVSHNISTIVEKIQSKDSNINGCLLKNDNLQLFVQDGYIRGFSLSKYANAGIFNQYNDNISTSNNELFNIKYNLYDDNTGNINNNCILKTCKIINKTEQSVDFAMQFECKTNNNKPEIIEVKRHFELDNYQITIHDNTNKDITKTIIFNQKPDAKTKTIMNDILIPNAYKSPYWFSKNPETTINSTFLSNSKQFGILGNNLCGLVTSEFEIKHNIVSVANKDQSNTMVGLDIAPTTNKSNKNFTIKLKAFPLINSFMKQNNIEKINKYKNAWFGFIPKVMESLLDFTSSISNNVFLGFILFLISIIIIFLPMLYIEYRSKKQNIGIKTPSMMDIVFQLLFMLMIYYVNAWIMSSSFILNNYSILWFKSINSNDTAYILNLFGLINIDLPFFLRFGPIGLMYSYIFINYLKIEINKFLFVIICILMSGFMPLGSMLFTGIFIVGRGKLIEYLTKQDDDIIRMK